MGRLAIARLEVILIVVFGGMCAVMAAHCDDRADRYKAEPSLDPDEITVVIPDKRQVKVPQVQAELAALDQRLTALRTQAITSDIDARRRREETALLERRFPALRSHGSRPLDPGAPSELVTAAKAFDDAAAAAELSAAVSSTLLAEVNKLDGDRLKTSSALRQAQRAVAVKLAQQRRQLDEDWWWEFLERTGPLAGMLALVGGVIAAALARGRRWIAGGAVFLSVTLIAIGALLYYLLPIAAALAGIVAGVAILVLAARSAR